MSYKYDEFIQQNNYAKKEVPDNVIRISKVSLKKDCCQVSVVYGREVELRDTRIIETGDILSIQSLVNFVYDGEVCLTNPSVLAKWYRFNEENDRLRICEDCLMGLESREGRLRTTRITLYEPEPCDWCDFLVDELYEIVPDEPKRKRK